MLLLVATPLTASTPPIQTFSRGGIIAADISPDGNYTATATAAGGVFVWNNLTGSLATYLADAGKIDNESDAIRFSSDSDELLFVARGGVASIYRVSDWQRTSHLNLNTLHGVSSASNCEISSDGSEFLIYSYYGTDVLGFDSQTGASLNSYALGRAATYCYSIRYSPSGGQVMAAFSGDGNTDVPSGEKSVMVWSTSTETKVLELEDGSTQKSAEFSSDGTEILSCNYYGSTGPRLYSASTGALITQYPDNNHDGARFSPDGLEIIASPYSSNQVHRYNKATALLNSTFTDSVAHKVTHFSIDAANNRIITYSSDFINSHNLTDDSLFLSIDGHEVTVSGIPAISSGGGRVAAYEVVPTGDIRYRMNLFGTGDGEIDARITPVASKNMTVAFSTDGTIAAFSNDATHIINAANQLVDTITHDDYVRCVAISPDNSLIATAASDGSAAYIDLWSVATGTLVRRMTTVAGTSPYSGAPAMKFSPDGSKLALGLNDDTVRVWEVSSGNILHSFNHTREVRAVAFSPNGTQLLAGDGSNRGILWTLATELEAANVSLGRTPKDAGFTPLGKPIFLLGSSSQNGQIFDVDSEVVTQELELVPYSFVYGSLSADGDQAILSNGNVAFLFDVTDTGDTDSDGDGLSDPDEALAGTNPNLADTDGDGLDDGAEVDNGLDPLTPNTTPAELAAHLETIKRNASNQQAAALFTEASLRDINLGMPILVVDPVTGAVSMDLQLYFSDSLDGDWQPLGLPLQWGDSGAADKAFYRISAGQ